MKQISRMTLLPLAVAVASGGGISPTFAEENRLALEEVVVTARKKEESLMDVPMSITAVSGETMVKMNIQEISDLAQSLPNLTFSQSGAGANAYIRGQGSGFNIAFEQSVGWFVDGIYGSRVEQFLAPMFDVSSVELLRGPQGTVLGKNIIAGAINIRTARPTEEFEGRVTGMYTDETDRRRIEAVVSGGLTDSVRARLAISDTQADGWLENTLPGAPDEGDTLEELDEQLVRLSVEVDITDNLQGFFKAEYTESQGDRTETGQVAFVQPPGSTPFPTAEALVISEQQDLSINHQAQTISPCARESRQAALAAACAIRGNGGLPFEDVEIYNYVADFRYDLDGYELAFVTGWSEFEQERVSVNDYGLGTLDAWKTEEFEQLSQEIRITSPGGQFVDWTAGFYYQDSTVDSTYANLVDYGQLAPDPGSFTGDLARDWEQNSETYSVFAEATFNVTDTFRFILGGRWTEEEKDYFKRFQLLLASTYDPITGGLLAGLGGALDPVTYFPDGVGGASFNGSFNLPDGTYTNILSSDGVLEGTGTVAGGVVTSSDTNTERETTLSGTLQYDVGDTQYYLTIAEGYKSGNWNENARSVVPERFDPEFATSYELGAKFVLADGAAELNTALFYVEYTDLQVSNWTGTRYIIGNAGEAVSQGLEVDGRWQISEYFMLSGAAAFLDSRYEELEFGCNTFQTVLGGAGCQSRDLGGGITQNFQDLDGENTSFAPELSGNLALDFEAPVSEAMLVSARVGVSYTAEQNASTDNHPLLVLPAATLWNARVGLSSADDTWDVAVVGRNIFDKRTVQFMGNGGTRFPGSFGGIHGLPKTITIQGTYRF